MYTLHVIHFKSVEILRTITITILATMLSCLLIPYYRILGNFRC